MKSYILKAIVPVLAVIMLLTVFSCSGSADITGYYTAEKSNTVMYFAPDGKIYENYSSESVSCYEVKGNKIDMYIEGEEDLKMSFDFKRTDDGFMIGDAKYVRIQDPETEGSLTSENNTEKAK